MFGKQYVPAEATVLYAEICDHSSYDWRTFEFILDVQPTMGPIFRTTIKEQFVAAGLHPRVNDVVKVKYDPKSLKVKFDLKGDPRYDLNALKDDTKVRREMLLSSVPGTPSPLNSSQAAQETQFILLQYAVLRKELGIFGQKGMAIIRHKQDAGMSFPPYVAYYVTVQVQPALGTFFDSTFTTWVNPQVHPLEIGDAIPIRYDATNPARIVFEFPT